MVQLQWFGHYGPSAHILWSHEWENICHFSLANTSKVSWWRLFNLSDSNLNSASSFIIPIMSNWNGPAAVDHNEQLEWSSCSGLGIMVPVLTYFGLTSGKTYATFPWPTHQKSAGGDCSTFQIPISTVHHHSSYP